MGKREPGHAQHQCSTFFVRFSCVDVGTHPTSVEEVDVEGGMHMAFPT